MVNTKVKLANLELDNPVMAASGTFGYGLDFAKLYDINILGSFSFKGTTKEERFGNPTPRIAESPSGILNSIGLQNPGIEHVIAEELPQLRKVFHKPVIANIGGFSLDEYKYCAERLDGEDCVGIIELNVSCPNVHGGLKCSSSPADAALVTREVKKVTAKPLFVKLSPNVTDICEMARAVEDAGADGLTLVNTLVGMRIDINKRKPILANKQGGFSGPAIFPVALGIVYRVYEAVKIPIIGVGGISKTEDVIEMMLAGARAVEIGAANLVNPFVCRDIINSLPEVMKKYNITDLEDIIGGAHNG